MRRLMVDLPVYDATRFRSARTIPGKTGRHLPRENVMIRKVLRWLDNNAEKTVIVISYAVMAAIVFTEVIKRFVFKMQSPWSTSIPVYMFLFVAWTGASYNVKSRTHLCFSELRHRFRRSIQFSLQSLDAVCWYIFGIIVIIYSSEQVLIAYENEAIVYGTDDLPLYFFFSITPISWCLILIRTTQNFIADIRKFRTGEAFVKEARLDS
jgi:TRAP-type C4-dicarboxylate transport system permease small subunit